MEDEAKKPNIKLWCFWISLAVVVIVFVIPVDRTTYEGDGVSFEFNYTIYDKIVGNGPKQKGRMYIDGKPVRR